MVFKQRDKEEADADDMDETAGCEGADDDNIKPEIVADAVRAHKGDNPSQDKKKKTQKQYSKNDNSPGDALGQNPRWRKNGAWKKK